MKPITKVSLSLVAILSMLILLLTSELFEDKLDSFLTVSAWVTKQEIKAGETITAELLTEVRIKPQEIFGSIQSHDKLVGSMLIVPKAAGSTIYLNEVIGQ